MVQLILDTDGYNITMPESKGYYPHKEALSESVQMISGRVVRELRGNVWYIEYQYGYFDNATIQNIMAACEKGMSEPITCGFLEQKDGETLTYSSFWVDSYQRPKFEWSKQTYDSDNNPVNVPMWADFSIVLREVEPSDY